MARVFFHYHDGVDRILDLEGADLTLEESRTRALGEVRALIAHDALVGRIDLRQRIDVEDVEGIVLDSIAFIDAVEILGLPVPGALDNGAADATGLTGLPRSRYSQQP
jgi:hypothetical protein